MRIIYAIVIVCLCALQLEAQSVWTGDVDSDWSKAGNWSPNVPSSGSTATIPGTPQGGNFPVYAGSPTIDYTIQNFGTITFNTFIYNLGTIVNFSDGNIINDGYFVNAGMIMFDNDGDFQNNSTFDNYGTFDNGGPGSNPANFNNAVGSMLNNYGTFKNTAILNNDGDINNFGSLRSTNTFNNKGKVINQGDMTNPSGSTFNNNAGATLANQVGASFAVNGVFNNQTNFTNEGFFELQSSVDFQNNATITNNKKFELAGELKNINSFINNDFVNITNSGNLHNTGSFQNNGSIETDVCGIIVQNSPNNIDGSVLHDGTLYQIQGTVNITNLEFGVTLYDINETKPPVPGCKAGVFIQLDENGTATLTAEQYDKGSYGSCGATIASRTISKSTFTTADLGSQSVSLTITDNLGMTSVCDNVITVGAYVAPIVDVDSPNIDFDCPADITVSTIPGGTTAVANWTEPTGTSNCAPAPMGFDCTNAPTVSGMTYLGTFGDTYFYKKTSGHLNYQDAKNFVAARGGTLPVIADQAENDFIAGFLNGGRIWLDLTDENSEGNFEWTTGAAFNYSNWNANEPNDYGTGEDYVQMLSNGLWNDTKAHNTYDVIMELACPMVNVVNCSDIPENIPNTIYLGEYNDSKYYCSTTNNYSWAAAKSWAEQNGGHLVTVNSAGENNFLKSTILAQTIWIGLNDAASEGNFVWDNGDPVNYTNWGNGDPNNLGTSSTQTNADYTALLKSDGVWRDRAGSDHYEAVMEIPCPSTVTPQTCSMEDHGVSDNGIGTRTVWLNFDNLTENKEYAVDANGASFQEFADGTASLTGTVERVDNANFKYSFSVKLINKRNWFAWSSLGRSFKPNTNAAANHTDWHYYEVDNNNSTFTGVGANAGKILQITHDPVDYNYGFQVGDGANLKDGDYGLSGWFGFSGDENGHGDFNADLNNCGMSSMDITVNQIAGPANGGNFPIGEIAVAYEVMDGCGNTEICTFNVTVEPTPTTITTNCPANIVVDAAPGASSAVVNYDLPTGSSNCFSSSGVEVALADGLESGSDFPTGVTGVSYSLIDSCNNVTTCFFSVTVNPVATVLTVTDCVGDLNVEAAIGETSATVTWATPTASTTCFTNNTTISQIQGPVSGSTLDLGTTPVAYLIADDCGNTEICYFVVTVTESCLAAGTACDDGDATTQNDVEDGNCNCAGTPCPTAGTTCDDGDASTENDVEDGSCNCSGTPCPTAGTTCDDGDVNTTNDVEDGNCNC
ncbi:MAG: lectin-like protein, partial [Saprospiraceae bacterium]